MRVAVSLLLIMFPILLFSQINDVEVDKKTYELYQKNQWRELIRYGKQVEEKGVDFYYLNIRMAIAYYEIGRFEKSKYYFEKSKTQSDDKDLANEYLYWIYLLTDREMDAYATYQELSVEAQERVGYKRYSIVESATPIFGYKFSDNQNVATDMLFYGINTQHKVMPGVRLSLSYDYLQQSLLWGKYNQHHLRLSGNKSFSKGWKVFLAADAFKYERSVNYNLDTAWIHNDSLIRDYGTVYYREDVDSYSRWRGKVGQQFYAFHFGLQREISGFKIKPQFTMMIENSNPQLSQHIFTEDSIVYTLNNQVVEREYKVLEDNIRVFNDSARKYYYQVGIDVSYTHHFNKTSQITAGLEVNYAGDNFKDYYFRPRLTGNITKYFEYGIWMLNKKAYPLSYSTGDLLYNSHDMHSFVYGAGFQVNLTQRFSVFASCVYSNTQDSFSGKSYNGCLVLTGLKIN